MKHVIHRGFSLLEVMAAVVILAVVTAATFATVAPMRAKTENRSVDPELATLNALVRDFRTAQGHNPENVMDLVDAGYLSDQSSDELARLRKIERSYDYSQATGTFSTRH